MSKYICLDFDGVIHSYVSPWKGECHIPDPPVAGAFEFIQLALDSGLRIGVYSTRNIAPGAVDAMHRWFAEHRMAQAYIDKIEFPTSKPMYAILFIDDRGFQFQGTFPSVEYCKTFKPWYK